MTKLEERFAGQAGEIKAGAESLLVIRFSDGEVTYTRDFRIILNGSLWPRQLEAANAMIRIFKLCHREDNSPMKQEAP